MLLDVLHAKGIYSYSVLRNCNFLFLSTSSSKFVLCGTLNSFQLLDVQVLQQEQHSFQGVTLNIHTNTPGCFKLHNDNNTVHVNGVSVLLLYK